MFWRAFTLTALAAMICCSNPYGLPDRDGLGVLDSTSFDEFLTSHTQMVVLLEKGEGIEKKELWGEYKAFASKLYDKQMNIPAVFVDVEENKSLADELNLSQFPAIMLFSNGKRLIYRGRLFSSNLFDWTLRGSKPKDERQLFSENEIRAVSEMRFAVLLRFPETDYDQKSFFTAAADFESDLPMYYTHLSLRNLGLGSDSPYSLIVFRQFDDGMKMMAGDKPLSEESMRQFVSMFKNPMIWPFDREVADKVYTGNTTILVYFAQNFTAANNQTFSNFAFQNRHKIRIHMCEFSDFQCLNLAYSVGFSDSDKHAVFILQNVGKGLQRYKMKHAFTENELTKFVDNFNGGLLTPYAKSEMEPTENGGVLKKAVRNTVGKMVLSSPKTTVFIGYSESDEWRDLEPIMERLAYKFGGESKIDFVKWDASKNEHENVYLTKVPQIQVFKKGNKSRPSVYLGKLEEKKIEEYLKATLGDELGIAKATEEETEL